MCSCNILIEIIYEGQEYLDRWVSTHVKYYPEEVYYIPPLDNFDLVNCSNSALTTDECNKATESRRAMMERVTKKEHDAKGKMHYFIFAHVLKF